MFNLVKNGEHVSLLGDFNAKSGKLSDYVKPDEELLDIFDLYEDIDLISYMYDYEELQIQKCLKIIWRKLKNNPQEKYPYMYVLLRDHLYPLDRLLYIYYFFYKNLEGNDHMYLVFRCIDFFYLMGYLLSINFHSHTYS
jgi:hypothetical protein